MKSRTIIAVALLLASTPVFAADLLAGDAGRIWFVRSADVEKTCDVFFKPLGGSWQAVVRNQTGSPAAAVASGELLHLFYANRQHVIVDTRGLMRVAENLPGDLIASCSGRNFGGAEKDQPAIFVLVRRDEPPRVSSSDTQPATAPTSPKSRGPYQCLYRLAGNQWMPIGRVALTAKEKPATPCLLALLNGKLYRLDRSEDVGPNTPFLMRRFAPADDGEMNWKILHTLPADQTPLGMVALKDRLCIVHTTKTDGATTTPAETTLTITRFHPSAKPPFSTLPITQNQNVAHWPADPPPRVSRLGEQLALLRRDEESAFFALCSPSGALGAAENITNTIETMPDVEWVNNLYNYFLMGVVVVVGVGMFFRRMRTPPQPFLLAKGLTPGNLFKRLLAVLVDFLPFYFITGAVFLPANLHLDTLQQFIEKPSTIPPSLLAAMIYTMMFSQGLYVVYGTVMEMCFGATAGKRLLRLRAVKEDGRRPDLRAAVLRNVTKIVELSMILSPMAWLLVIFVLLPLLTRNRQRLGDMIARTAVVEASSLKTMEKTKKENANVANQEE